MADANPPDLIILSDLHLGAGKDPESGRWSRFEDFFYDRELCSFLDHLHQEAETSGRGVRLILNGDCLDFLTVVDVPDKEEARARGILLPRNARKFGLPPTARATVWKLERIARGHPAAFDAIARFLLRGHELVVLPGNHDPELYFEEVQARFAELLCEHARALEPDCDTEALRARMRFERWFYYEPGRIFVEHGHQYEETNVVTHLLHPLSARRNRQGEAELDHPVGSYFVRYLHNALKQQNPYMRNFISLEHYIRFLSGQNIIRSLRQSYRNATFLMRALADIPLWTGASTQALYRKHRELREELAAKSGLGEALAGLEALWPAQMARTKTRLARKLIAPAIRQSGLALGLVLVTIYAWSLFFNLILAVPWLAEGPFAKAGWLSLFSVLTFAVVAVVVRTVGQVLRSKGDVSFSSLERYADRAAALVKTPNFSLGHTHLAERRRLSAGAVYVNSGTWTAIQGPWDEINPRGMQFTFARLDPSGFHARRWNHPSREETAVDLFEPPREGFLQALEEMVDPRS